MRILTPKQAIAVQLCRQGHAVAQVQLNTGLDREQIIAACDLAETNRFRHPNTPPPPNRKRTERTAA